MSWQSKLRIVANMVDGVIYKGKIYTKAPEGTGSEHPCTGCAFRNSASTCDDFRNTVTRPGDCMNSIWVKLGPGRE